MLVSAAYTSRTCRACRYESAENRKTQSLFRCVACGHEEHADIHAAKNVLAAGHAVWAQRHTAPPAAHGEAVRRESIPAASAKWEPAEARGLA
jgi:putative transposase